MKTATLRRSKFRAGFTLMEALATLALIGIVLPVVMHAISTTTDVASLSIQRTHAAALAESKLMELVATKGWEESSLEGEFDETQLASSASSLSSSSSGSGVSEVKYRWTASVQDWQDDRVQQLDVTVTWESRGAQQQVTLSTLVRVEEQ